MQERRLWQSCTPTPRHVGAMADENVLYRHPRSYAVMLRRSVEPEINSWSSFSEPTWGARSVRWSNLVAVRAITRPHSRCAALSRAVGTGARKPVRAPKGRIGGGRRQSHQRDTSLIAYGPFHYEGQRDGCKVVLD